MSPLGGKRGALALDAARIDYLERLGAHVECVELHPDNDGARWAVLNPVAYHRARLGAGATWRAAVDAAMAAYPPPE